MNLESFLLEQIHQTIVVRNQKGNIIYQNRPFFDENEAKIENDEWYIPKEERFFKEIKTASILNQETIEICEYRDITQLKLLEHISHIDPLTKVYNRRYLFRQYQMNNEYYRYVVMIDVDQFKALNDQLGHAMGDTALKIISDTLLSQKEEHDIVCRYGGDEFLVLTELENCDALLDWIEKIQDKIKKCTKELIGNEVNITIGYVAFDRTEDIQELIKKADNKMYHNKCKR